MGGWWTRPRSALPAGRSRPYCRRSRYGKRRRRNSPEHAAPENDQATGRISPHPIAARAAILPPPPAGEGFMAATDTASLPPPQAGEGWGGGLMAEEEAVLCGIDVRAGVTVTLKRPRVRNVYDGAPIDTPISTLA